MHDANASVLPTGSRLLLLLTVGTLLSASGCAALRTALALARYESAHYRLVCHFPACDAPAAQALEAAESAWEQTASVFGEPRAGAPRDLLTIHLYRTRADFDAARRKKHSGVHRVNSFANVNSRSAYVFIRPGMSDVLLRRLGLPPPTLRIVAHEAAHLAVSRIESIRQFYPDWLGEGSATWAAQRAMASLGVTSSMLHDPRTGARIGNAQRLLEDGYFPRGDSLFMEKEGRHKAHQYGVHYLLFAFLEGTPKYRPVLDALIQTEHALRSHDGAAALKNVPDSIHALPDRLDALERDFHAYVASLKPRWTGGTKSTLSTGDTWMQFTTPPKGATWRLDSLGAARYTLTGQFEILPGAGQQVNVLLGCSRGDVCYDGRPPPAGTYRAIKVAFAADAGVRLLAHAGGAGDSTRWTLLAEGGTVQASQRTPFRISRRRDRVVVSLRGDSLLSAPFERTARYESWGLGGESGTVARWYDVHADTLR
jgi:hypothetical protein